MRAAIEEMVHLIKHQIAEDTHHVRKEPPPDPASALLHLYSETVDPTSDEFEAVACNACAALHWVNPKTGKVLGADKE